MKKLRLSAAMIVAALSASPLQAATVTFEYDVSFGAVTPDGPAPYATAVIDDGGGSGSVTLTMSASGNIGVADITGMYFNLSDDSQTTLDGLTFANTGGEVANSIDATTNAHMAGGDGSYDILFDYLNNTFNAGESSVYTITGVGLTASDFNIYGEPGPGAGNPGPFLSVARFQSTGFDGNGSDWVGAVPVPAAVWLFGSGLLGLIGIARRKKAA
jgi:hypothetical protein